MRAPKVGTCRGALGVREQEGFTRRAHPDLFGDPKVVTTRNIVEPLLRQLKKTGHIDDLRNHHHQILTNAKRRKLADWILACADGQDPKNRTQISSYGGAVTPHQSDQYQTNR